MTAFATAEDLAALLAVDAYTDAELAQVNLLLDLASDHLRALIGQNITAQTITYTAVLDGDERWLRLPQYPVREVTTILNGDVEVSDWQLIDQQVLLGAGCLAGFAVPTRYGVRSFTVTYEAGYLSVPGELRTWTLVLASQGLAQLQNVGALGTAGVTSERVDDYAVNFATTGEAAAAFSIPGRVEQQLRATYGGGAYVTSSR